MNERRDVAFAVALAVLEIVGRNPDAEKHRLLTRITEIILLAIEANHEKRVSEPSAN